MNPIRITSIVGFALLFLWIPLAFINGRLAWLTFIAGAIIIVFMSIAVNGEKRDTQDKKLKELKQKLFNKFENIKETDYIIEISRGKIIALEPEKEFLHFVFDKEENDVESISFQDILEVHIVEDGTSITKTSRGSQFGGALVGGILAGGAGAVIGGLSGKTKTTKEVKKIELTLLVNDTENPLRRFTFFNHSVGVKTTNKTYIQMKIVAEKWYNRFKVIIHRQDQKDEKINA